MLKPGGLFTSTEFSLGPGGDIIYPLPWAYDASINFLEPEEVMRAQFDAAGFRIREWTDYSDTIVRRARQTEGKPSNKLDNYLVFGDDALERRQSSQRNLAEKRIIYWMITAERRDRSLIQPGKMEGRC